MRIRQLLALLLVAVCVIAFDGCRRRGAKKPAEKKDYARQLEAGERALVEVDASRLPSLVLTPANREAVRRALEQSLAFLAKPGSARFYPISGISREQVQASVTALRDLLASPISDAELNTAIHSRFRVLMSVGCDDQGTVLFTGYCTPIYEGRLARDDRFRHPLYKRPADLVTGVGDEIAKRRMPDGSLVPYPAREELLRSGELNGKELVWFADPFEAYVVQVQGSGKVRLETGEVIDVGYDGTNNHRYQPIADQLIADGKIKREELSLATMRAYFRSHPDEVATYAAKNPRFIFFTRTKGGPFGSLGQPVTTDVTIATDKTIFPPAAPAVVQTSTSDAAGTQSAYAALRVDQDSGGAIRAPGRCDLYTGVGDAAERRAGFQLAEGKLFYLILRE
jgi:membrane-bound lytic murein transglycosylase A